MIRFIIFVLLIGLVYFLVRSYFLNPNAEEETSGSMDMVECAQCKVYVPRKEGTFQEMPDNKNLFFCGESCARQYRENI